MNKQTSTFNATDVYSKLVDKLLRENPTWWSISKGTKTRSVMRKLGNGIVQEVISQKRFMQVINLYYLVARKKIIRGESVRISHRLGIIQARTIQRNFNNKQVNWAETKKQPFVTDPVTGKVKRARVIYHMEDTYSRIGWERPKGGGIANEIYYQFKPAQGNSAGKGFTGEFSAALKADPLLQFRYKQFNDELSTD